ncbi:immunity 49 family protein [Chryseobacterium zhengzhouense]|uniref:Immunity 49 family protein n=1 Tax=Chryseobacterium zhengzhouense TaxID=1636086 RepID=A0ABW2M6D7_9FLAO
MEKISLHKVDAPEVINSNFIRRQKRYPENLEDAKKIFGFLFYVYKDFSEFLQMSVLEKPELSQQKYWFTYGLNCISEFCRLAHFPNEVKEAQIDEDVFFSIKVESLGELRDVSKPLQLARIARDKEKENIIASVPLHLLDLEGGTTFNNKYAKILTKLEIEYSLTSNFNKEYYESLVDIYNKNLDDIQAKISSGTSHVLYYIHPYVNAFKSLVDDNETEFNQNLIKAIQAHKEVWSQKKALNRGGTPLCRENEGFLSWDCTALAAMAYDKGWKLEVESDYMPSFMIDGSINK